MQFWNHVKVPTYQASSKLGVEGERSKEKEKDKKEMRIHCWGKMVSNIKALVR